MAITKLLPKVNLHLSPQLEEEARNLSIKKGLSFMEALSFLFNGCGEFPYISLTHETDSSTSIHSYVDNAIRMNETEIAQVTLYPAQLSLSRWLEVSR